MIPPRRKRYYYEIHLGGAVVDGVQEFSGMLEAENAVDRRAEYLRSKLDKPLRGYLIMRLRGRRMSHRHSNQYGEKILL